MKGLQHKLGPLKLWQWAAIGGGGGLLLYLYKKKKAASEGGISPTEEEKLLGALAKIGGGGGENAGIGGGTGNANPPVAPPPPPTPPTPEVPKAVEPAPPAPPTAPPSPSNTGNENSSISNDLSRNHPPTNGPAPASKNEQGYVRNTQKGNPRYGQEYRIVHKNGNTYHVYKSGAVERIGKAAKRKPAKRPKPVPIHQRVSNPKPLRRPEPKAKPRRQPSRGRR